MLRILQQSLAGFDNQRWLFVDARRNLQRVEEEWYPRLLVVHRFMVPSLGEPSIMTTMVVPWFMPRLGLVGGGFLRS